MKQTTDDQMAILSNVAASLAEADDLLRSLKLDSKNNIGRYIGEAVKATAELAYEVAQQTAERVG